MALTTVKGSVLPDVFPGVIWMFAGTEEQIEKGWQLCNGEGETSNGIKVPNLMDRMIVCSGNSYKTGNTGGATSATTSAAGNHSHSVSVNNATLSLAQTPSHNHRQKSEMWNWAYDGAGAYTAGGPLHNQNTLANTRTESVGSSGAHSHSGSSNTTGNHSHSVATMPPYYTLAFIIKL